MQETHGNSRTSRADKMRQLAGFLGEAWTCWWTSGFQPKHVWASRLNKQAPARTGSAKGKKVSPCQCLIWHLRPRGAAGIGAASCPCHSDVIGGRVASVPSLEDPALCPPTRSFQSLAGCLPARPPSVLRGSIKSWLRPKQGWRRKL